MKEVAIGPHVFKRNLVLNGSHGLWNKSSRPLGDSGKIFVQEFISGLQKCIYCHLMQFPKVLIKTVFTFTSFTQEFAFPCSLKVRFWPIHHLELLSVLKNYIFISWVQSLSRVLLFATPCTASREASLSITNSQRYHIFISNHYLLATLLLLTYLLLNFILTLFKNPALLFQSNHHSITVLLSSPAYIPSSISPTTL